MILVLHYSITIFMRVRSLILKIGKINRRISESIGICLYAETSFEIEYTCEMRNMVQFRRIEEQILLKILNFSGA